jgi:hypothetical protein
MNETSAREKGFRLKLWLRFAAFWIVVMGIGFTVSFYVLPYGLLWLAMWLTKQKLPITVDEYGPPPLKRTYQHHETNHHRN